MHITGFGSAGLAVLRKRRGYRCSPRVRQSEGEEEGEMKIALKFLASMAIALSTMYAIGTLVGYVVIHSQRSGLAIAVWLGGGMILLETGLALIILLWRPK
jgi:hypothetical protein